MASFDKSNLLKNAYIGRKGYTILKSDLSTSMLKNVYTDLYAKPFTPINCGGGAQSEGFYCYRENTNKIYIPRFYGIEQFGIPEKNELIDNDCIESIDVEFTQSLRDYQEKIVNIYLENLAAPPPSGRSAQGNKPGQLIVFHRAPEYHNQILHLTQAQ